MKQELAKGLIIKNYKVLCEEYLGVKPTKGNARKYHFKELERYCEYHKEGQKIIIDNVYKDKKEKIDMRKSEYISETDKRHNGNNTFYGEDIEKLLLLMMASTMVEDELILPMSIILNKISMVNSNYSIGRRNQERLSEILKIDEKYVNEFYDTTHSNLRSTLESALNRLDKKALLRWKTVRMVCKKVAVVKYNELDEIEIDMDTDRVQYTIQEEYNIATKEQDLIIIEAENKILEEMELNNLNEVIRYGKINEFYKKVYEIVKKKANIKYYFNGYNLIFNRGNIIKELDKYGEDLEEIKNQLNQKVKEKTLDNAIKRQEKTEKETTTTKGFGNKRKTEKQNLRLSDTYLNNIQLLIDTVIDIKAKSIRKQINKSNIK